MSELLHALHNLPMTTLRDIGYALEPIAGENVRAGNKVELVSEIITVVENVGGGALVVVKDYLPDTASAERENEPETANVKEDEPSDTPAEPEVAVPDGNPEKVFMLLATPQEGGIWEGDLVVNPKPLLLRYRHSWISWERACELRRLLKRQNTKYSNSPNIIIPNK